MYDSGYTKCKCPIVIRGTLNGNRVTQGTGKYLRAPLDRDLDAASQLAQQWERTGQVGPLAAPLAPSGTPAPEDEEQVTVEAAVAKYMADAKDRGNNESTLIKKDVCFARRLKIDTSNPQGPRIATSASSLLLFCDRKGIRFLGELTLEVVSEWRSTWQVGSLERHKRQGRVLGFFWFCERRNWFPRNYAADMTVGLGKVQVKTTETGYFLPEQYAKLIDTTHVYSDRPSIDKHDALTVGGERIRAVAELMRWTGLRIRDAVTLERHRLCQDINGKWRVILYQRKTGDPVYCRIPPHVVQLLCSVPASQKKNTNDRYFFWTGNGMAKSLVSNWQRSFRKLFQMADLKTTDGAKMRCHPHMFRDTFAVESILSGLSVKHVSILLGHKSIRTTENHYMPWVLARQKSLDMEIEKSWEEQGVSTGAGKPGRRKVVTLAATG